MPPVDMQFEQAGGVSEVARTQRKTFRVALAGNPNSGKTTLFNALTGLSYKVANYPGVTVEKKSGKLELPKLGLAELIDLPGVYSLPGISLDEQVAADVLFGFLKTEPAPDAVIIVVDATNLERNLYLATQLIDMGLPIVVALNLHDLAIKQGIKVYPELLSRALDVPVLPTVANKAEGTEELLEALEQVLQKHSASRKRFDWLQDEDLKLAAAKLGASFPKTPTSASNDLFFGICLLSDTLPNVPSELQLATKTLRDKLLQTGQDPLSLEANSRYAWINSVVKSCTRIEAASVSKFATWFDHISTHKVWGTVTFTLCMLFIFQSIFLWSQLPMDFIEGIVNSAAAALRQLLPAGELQSLLSDGVIAGVGSVLVFIPQIGVLFFFLGLLEDSGYLCRAAFIMDRFMRPFGLQGRSFIPMLSSFACAIPGILSTRTIPSKADRLTTILVAPLMSCSARLPVYAVLIGAFIPRTSVLGFISLQGLVLFSMYLLGILGAIGVAKLIKSTLLKHEPTVFVMELPPFRVPSLRNVLRNVVDRIGQFIKNAGTLILAFSIVLWFLASYPKPHPSMNVSPVAYSYAGQIGKAIEPVIAPLGFNWELGVGLLASFAAREVFVSSLATVYNLEGDGATTSLTALLKEKHREGSFYLLTACSLLVFYVFACQCISTLSVCYRETRSWGWTSLMFGYMTALAYTMSFITFQGGKLIFGLV